MAKILIVSHACDTFRTRPRMIHALLPIWLQQGHQVGVCEGPANAQVQADVAILHVDASLVTEDYVASVQRFPVVINGGVNDIRKSVLSSALLARGDAWSGPVMVKSDLNAGGLPEFLLNEQARRVGSSEPYPGAAAIANYPIFASLDQVPEVVWSRTDLVVEKFQPEYDQHGFWTRFWLFFGSRGRARRFCTREPIVKAGAAILREECDVPDEVRAVRERLGLHFGKIDFAMHEGRAIVFDVNKTPGMAPSKPGDGPSTAEQLAPGLDEFFSPR